MSSYRSPSIPKFILKAKKELFRNQCLFPRALDLTDICLYLYGEGVTIFEQKTVFGTWSLTIKWKRRKSASALLNAHTDGHPRAHSIGTEQASILLQQVTQPANKGWGTCCRQLLRSLLINFKPTEKDPEQWLMCKRNYIVRSESAIKETEGLSPGKFTPQEIHTG